MIRTIDEILEKSEEKRMGQEFDEFYTELLQLNISKPEILSPEELEKRQKEWEEMTDAEKLKSLLIPKSEEIGCILIRPSKCWGISPKLKNLNLTGAAGGICSEEK